jgi:hypothetical protein
VYRDGDCMTQAEKDWLLERANALLPDRAELYISKHTDIEHYFCSPEHIAEVAHIDIAEARDIVQTCITADQARLAVKATNKRNDLKNKSQKGNPNFESTERLLADGVQFEMALGSLLLPKILSELDRRGHPVRQLNVASAHIADFDFSALLD